MEILKYVTRGGLTFGVVVGRDGWVRRAPPVAAWMKGKQWSECEKWLLKKGARIDEVPEVPAVREREERD